MAEENVKNLTSATSETDTNVETKDRGLFDKFLGKKDDNETKPQNEEEVVMASEFDQKVQVSEPVHEDKKKPGLLGKLHRSDSSSSSSSEEEEVEGEDGVKIKRKKEKKGLKEKIKEKISGEKSEEKKEGHHQKHDEETHVPVEVVHVEEEAPSSEEKKGFLDKIKEKLPGGTTGHPKTDETLASPTTTVPAATVETHHEDGKEKKGFLDKIKEKLPGYHPKSDEDKEKEKDSAASH